MPNKYGNKVPILAADSETDPFEYGLIPQPFIWGLYDGVTGEYLTFKTVEAFVKHVRKLKAIVYAHNGGKFDYHFLVPYMEPDKPLLVIAGRIARFQIGDCEFRDSFSILPFPLSAYKKDEIEYWKLHKKFRDEYMAEILSYLKSDCVNLWNLVNEFEKEYGRHLTQAGAAMEIWQKMSKRRAPRSGPFFYDTFRPFYFGGRVQCFKPGDFSEDVKLADINSAYPFAMLHRHPISTQYNHGEGTPKHLEASEYGPLLFRIEAISKGAFPYPALNKMLYFPDDNEVREYKITGWELLAAMETKTVKRLKILDYYEFSETYAFTDYINHFWKKRQAAKAAGDKAQDLFCKIFMNGLYGKFAANPRQYFNTSLVPPEMLEEIVSEMRRFDFFGPWLLVQDEQPPEKHRYYNLATAASITGFVRAMLWREIHRAETPFYCDTDSITARGFPKMPLGDALGQWKFEGDFDRVIVCGKKLYAMHKKGEPENNKKSWKVASKGARLDYKAIARIAAGQTELFKSEVPTYSVHHKAPRFIDRKIVITAEDVRRVPRKYDPKYNTGESDNGNASNKI